MTRIIFDIFLFLSIFLFPWWFATILMMIAAFILPTFYEMLFLGIIIDSLYNAAINPYYHIHFVVTFGAIVVFAIAEILKRQLRFYARS